VPTKEDIFEQIVGFTLSEQYRTAKGLIDCLTRNQDILNVSEAEEALLNIE